MIEVTDAAVRLRQPGWVRPETVAASIGKRLPAMNVLAAVPGAEPGSARAVKAVSMTSTGTVRVYPEHPYRNCKLREPVQLGESGPRIPIRRSFRTGRVPELAAEVVIRSGGPAGLLLARVASCGNTPRGWWGYPVDRFERAIGRQVRVLAVDR